MVRFKNLIERIYPRLKVEEVVRGSDKRNSFNRSCTDAWSALESSIQRGLPEEIISWRQNYRIPEEEGDTVDGATQEDVDTNESGEERGFTDLAMDAGMEEEMNKCRYIRRCVEFASEVKLTPLQLAVMEKRVDVVLSLLIGLTPDQIFTAINTKIKKVEKVDQNSSLSKKTDTRKFFSTVSSLASLGSVEVGKRVVEVDWTDTLEWTTLHLAVKYHVEASKVLLFLMESQGDQDRIDQITDAPDPKGRTILHLAARCPNSSTPVKLLLDLGVKVCGVDEYGLAPVCLAVRFGCLDSVRVLLHHAGDRNRFDVDLQGRGLLHYSASPDITRYLLRRGYTPELCTIRYQISEKRTENVTVFLENTVSLQENLLILDFSLAMEQDQDGDLETDGESVFLKDFLTHRQLLRTPLAESLLWMKWFACKRVILLDLFFYVIFISCLTGVICYSTLPRHALLATRNLTSQETALVDTFIANYRDELERRGWTLDTDSPPAPVSDELPSNPALVGAQEEAGVYPDTPLQDEFAGLYYFTVALSIIFVLREFLELVAQGPSNYFNSVENIFEVFIICLTILCQILLPYYSENVEIYEIIQVLTVFFGWLGLTFHFAKLPNIGIYIYLAVKVFRQLVLSLLVFTTILLAFAFSFHLALRKHAVFDNAFTSFLKMINMMVGEYNFDYNFTFESVKNVEGSNGMVQFLLVSFILLVSVTIANMIIAIVIANISKLMDEADYYQLGRTVDLLSTVHNVKQALIRIFPCLKRVFAPTLHDYVGKKTMLCVKLSDLDPALSWIVRLQNCFTSATRFYSVYTYDTKFRDAGYQTNLVLPDKIVSSALETCRSREVRDKEELHSYSLRGETEDYRSDWRDEVGDVSLQAPSWTI